MNRQPYPEVAEAANPCTADAPKLDGASPSEPVETRIEADGEDWMVDKAVEYFATMHAVPPGYDPCDCDGCTLSAEVRRLRGEAVLLNDLIKDRDENALDDARAEVAEGCVALEGTCRDLSIKLSESEAEVRRLREHTNQISEQLTQALVQAKDANRMREERDLFRTASEAAELRIVELRTLLTASEAAASKLSAKLARVEAEVTAVRRLRDAASADRDHTVAAAFETAAMYFEEALRDEPQPEREPKLPYNGY